MMIKNPFEETDANEELLIQRIHKTLQLMRKKASTHGTAKRHSQMNIERHLVEDLCMLIADVLAGIAKDTGKAATLILPNNRHTRIHGG